MGNSLLGGNYYRMFISCFETFELSAEVEEACVRGAYMCFLCGAHLVRFHDCPAFDASFAAQSHLVHQSKLSEATKTTMMRSFSLFGMPVLIWKIDLLKWSSIC